MWSTDQTEAKVINRAMGPVSYRAEFFPYLEKETIDLSARLIVTATAQSNFVAAVRAQLPYGRAVFVLDVRQPESATNRIEFLITAYEFEAKGNIVSHRPASGK
jgi:hypothetical protein